MTDIAKLEKGVIKRSTDTPIVMEKVDEKSVSKRTITSSYPNVSKLSSSISELYMLTHHIVLFTEIMTSITRKISQRKDPAFLQKSTMIGKLTFITLTETRKRRDQEKYYRYSDSDEKVDEKSVSKRTITSSYPNVSKLYSSLSQLYMLIHHIFLQKS